MYHEKEKQSFFLFDEAKKGQIGLDGRLLLDFPPFFNFPNFDSIYL